MAEGSLKVFVYTGKQTVPIEEAEVILVTDGKTSGIRLTDSSGLAGPFFIEAPPVETGLSPGAILPYKTVDLVVSSPGFQSARFNGIRIFPERESVEAVELIPLPEGVRESTVIYNLKEAQL